nr:MAG TPA: ubiquitin conjugating enzyme [Caudoviricetes sp.]
MYLENLIPAHFPRTAGEIRIPAYQGHAGKMERNI